MKSSSTAVIVLGLSVAWFAGCGRNVDSKEAVRQGVMNYLAKRSDLLAMDVTVTSVAFHQDEATATVHFQAKGNSSPGAGMNMEYVLERQGNQWAVKNRAGGSGNPHAGVPQGLPSPGPGSTGAPPNTGSGSIGAMPNTGSGSIGAMPNTGTGGGSIGAAPQALPPGHPSVPNGVAPSGALPPGHPAVNPGQSADRSK